MKIRSTRAASRRVPAALRRATALGAAILVLVAVTPGEAAAQGAVPPQLHGLWGGGVDIRGDGYTVSGFQAALDIVDGEYGAIVGNFAYYDQGEHVCTERLILSAVDSYGVMTLRPRPGSECLKPEVSVRVEFSDLVYDFGIHFSWSTEEFDYSVMAGPMERRDG